MIYRKYCPCTSSFFLLPFYFLPSLLPSLILSVILSLILSCTSSFLLFYFYVPPSFFLSFVPSIFSYFSLPSSFFSSSSFSSSSVFSRLFPLLYYPVISLYLHQSPHPFKINFLNYLIFRRFFLKTAN